jgi:hypothetical protein
MSGTCGTARKKALLLGMVYSKESEPKRGQEYRDRVRCEALERHGGYEVFSLDNKHNEEGLDGKHCRANFADPRRMAKSIYDSFGENIAFDIVILDYFFCPVISTIIPSPPFFITIFRLDGQEKGGVINFSKKLFLCLQKLAF